MPRHSKLQKQVLGLYRMLLRASANKPGVKEYVTEEFRKNATMDKKDVLHVEYLVRRGEKYLENLQHVDGVTFMKPK